LADCTIINRKTEVLHWKDIKAIKTNFEDINTKYGRIKENFIKIIVNEPKEYIKRQKNILLKIFLIINYKLHDTPIIIHEGILSCNFFELEHNLSEGFNKYNV